MSMESRKQEVSKEEEGGRVHSPRVSKPCACWLECGDHFRVVTGMQACVQGHVVPQAQPGRLSCDVGPSQQCRKAYGAWLSLTREGDVGYLGSPAGKRVCRSFREGPDTCVHSVALIGLLGAAELTRCSLNFRWQ